MLPKKHGQQEQRRKSIVIPTKSVAGETIVEGGEENEVAAQISVPIDGGWGYVVLICSFLAIFIIDGSCFTFGAIANPLAQSLNTEMSLCALINSVQCAVSFFLAPIGSALINEFGFRNIAMLGAIISYTSLMAVYYSTNYYAVLFFLGFMTGFGESLSNTSASLVVGFYFEKYRAIASAISTGGSSLGIMTLYPINNYIANLSGWRTVILMNAALHGIIYFLSLSFRPLLSLTLQTENVQTVAMIPTASNAVKTSTGRIIEPRLTEQVLDAPVNPRFPTALEIVEENLSAPAEIEPTSTSAAIKASKLILTAQGPASKRQIDKIESMASKAQMAYENDKLPEQKQRESIRTSMQVDMLMREQGKRSCCGSCWNWYEEIASRPLYRDDAFFYGNIKDLPVYQKKVDIIKEDNRTGLEYQMAVTRAATVKDLKERRSICGTAMRRVLSSMLSPILLTRKSFILVCISSLINFLGVLVPYVYIQDRNLQNGMDEKDCSNFVSVISLSNLFGRFFLAYLTTKIEVVYLYSFCVLIAGVSTCFSSLSYVLYYQYAYCIVFGCFISANSALRCPMLVQLYGLKNLTNGFGLVLLFTGFGILFGTPLAALIQKQFSYTVSFYVSGICIIISGVLILPVKRMVKYETKRSRPSTTKRESIQKGKTH